MKPVILTNFGYQRKGWIMPIEHLRQWFDVHYIHFYSKEAETAKYTDAPVYYWADFSDAYALLDTIKPVFVLFMGLESGASIALNFASKKSQIPTYYLQHGLYSTYLDYRIIEKFGKVTRKVNEFKNTNRTSSSKFIIATFKKTKSYRSLLLTTLYVNLIQYLSSYVQAAKLIKFKARMPDSYICYSSKNAAIHYDIDGANSSNVKLIGYPEFDSFFQDRLIEKNNPNPYYLLIDQPLAENRFGNVLTTKDIQIEFYKKIALFSSNRKVGLKIKLHPESYNCTWLPQLPGVQYVRDEEEVNQLIKGAEGCLGFLSTLTLPAIFFKPTIIFQPQPHSFYNFIKEHRVCPLYDFNSFDESNLKFPSKIGSQSKAFVEAYFPFVDGKTIERLRDIF